MGVELREECDGEAPIEMACDHCGHDEQSPSGPAAQSVRRGGTFWTDETMNNTCPSCGHNSMTPA
jgi:rubredoxin